MFPNSQIIISKSSTQVSQKKKIKCATKNLKQGDALGPNDLMAKYCKNTQVFLFPICYTYLLLFYKGGQKKFYQYEACIYYKT